MRKDIAKNLFSTKNETNPKDMSTYMKITCGERVLETRHQSKRPVFLKEEHGFYVLYTSFSERIESFRTKEIAEILLSVLLTSIETMQEDFNVNIWLEDYIKKVCKENGYKLICRPWEKSEFIYVEDRDLILRKIEVKDYVSLSFIPQAYFWERKDLIKIKGQKNIKNLLDASLNKPVKYLFPKYKEYEAYTKEFDRATAENKTLEKELHMITGIDVKIDYRDNDFAVYVNLKEKPFEEQLLFVRQYKNKIVKYLNNEIIKKESIYKRHIGKIGDMNFYYLSKITLTRASQVEFLFSVKKGVEQLLVPQIME